MKAENPSSPSQDPARHAAHVVDLAKKLANGTRPGVLATVDADGKPHLRWMATLSLDEYPLLQTITSPSSRKIEHIRRNPHVSWMFADEAMTTIINISGTAHLIEDPARMNRVWKLLEDKSRAYFLNLFTDNSGFAVIETEIEEIECVIPKYDFRFRAHPAEVGRL